MGANMPETICFIKNFKYWLVFTTVFNASQVVQLLDGAPSTRVTFFGGPFWGLS